MGNVNLTPADIETLEAMMDFEQAYDDMMASILNEFNVRIHNAASPEETSTIINEYSHRILALKRFYDGIYSIVEQI